MLSIQKVSKIFDSQKIVLNNVTLSVNPGEIFALIGPNGSGKTTLVKMIAGLLQTSSGKIIVDSFDVAKQAEKSKALVGYIPDEPSIWPYLTGQEFLELTGALFRMSAHERQAKIPKLLEIFKLSGLEQQFFDEYSRGNKQKFSILAALLHNPKLLLVDEPIVGLDPGSAETAKQQFVHFAKRGGAILLVTHTLPVAQAIAHRIGILKNGKLIAVGSLSELRRKAKLSVSAPLEAIYQSIVR
ncbi:MAG: ABC transporter ATP-binding protein [Candidatus Falkowbacteria bacterium]